MQLTPNEISKIQSSLFSRIREEFEKANERNELERIIDKYGISFDPEPVPVFTKTQKILVLGDIAVPKQVLVKAAKYEFGISENNLEFENDYERLGRFNTTTLKYSTVYSDIILGPVPHKQAGIGDNSSLATAIERDKVAYPRLLKSKNLSKPLSKTEFIELLNNSRYVETLRKEVN